MRDHIFELISFLETGQISTDWRLPSWMHEYREELLNALLPKEIIEEYTMYHDCSKPQCRVIDENGKQHFPNHAQLSGELWLKIGGNREAATLMSMDMDIHNLKDVDVNEFVKRPQAITLLIAGLAEIISNSQMFGGQNSVSFKIKYKHIDKRGRAICKKLFT